MWIDVYVRSWVVGDLVECVRVVCLVLFSGVGSVMMCNEEFVLVVVYVCCNGGDMVVRGGHAVCGLGDVR